MTFDVVAGARRRTRRLVITVLVLVAVCAGLIYPLGLYANSRFEHTTPPGSGATSPPAATTATSDASVPVVLPADVTWVTVAGVALPVSDAAGPRVRAGGLASGFAHTPAGALLAAVHLLVNTTPQVGPAVFEPTLAAQVVGEDAAAMRAGVEADYAGLGGDTAIGGPVGVLRATLAGALLPAYTDAAATIDLLTVAVDATGAARFAASLVDVIWTGTDWALVAPLGGRWDGVVRPVTAAQAATYPPLSPVR